MQKVLFRPVLMISFGSRQRSSYFQRRLLSAATERPRKSRCFVRRRRNGPWTFLDISGIGSRRRSGENSHLHDSAAVLTRCVFHHRLHETTPRNPRPPPFCFGFHTTYARHLQTLSMRYTSLRTPGSSAIRPQPNAESSGGVRAAHGAQSSGACFRCCGW